MTTEALKSAAITNLDAIPYVRNTAGEGGNYRLDEIDAYITTSGSMAALSTYKMVRIRSNVKVKSLLWESAALGAGKFNIGLYYSDATNDGTPPAKQGTALDDDFFATDLDCASAVNQVQIVNESGTYTLAKRQQPIWQAAGLTVDPGGYFDVVAVVHTTDITTGGLIGCRLQYAE
jgi:hypothetical protein